MTNDIVRSEQSASVKPAVLLGGAALLLIIAGLAVSAHGGALTAPKAIILGAVEGITEYLPVSSTGHLLVAEHLLGLGHGANRTAADTYAIAIQLGAILAVVTLYRNRLVQLASGLVGRDDEGRRLLVALTVAFMPAAVVGVALDHTIKDHLFGPPAIIFAWTIGGVFLIWWRPRYGSSSLAQLDVRGAAIIGAAQVLALWPGVSRSLVTLVAAIALGLEIGAAVEFTFLLGLATLTAATALDLTKDGHSLLHDFGWQTPLLGILVAFATAVLAVRWLVTFLRSKPLTIFGWYRIAIASLAIVLIIIGVL